MTATQKAQVRMYLGWSDRFHSFDSRLEQAFLALTAEAETLVLAELARCVALDTAIDGARGRFKAAAVGSIQLQGPTELGLLRSQGRAASGRIASIMGVGIQHDVWSGAGPKAFASTQGYGGGGNLPPMG